MDDSHPFCSMSIGRSIHEIRLFQTLTLKLQSQGHGCDQKANHIVSPVSYWLASFSFHINQTNNSWDTAISKFDLEISKVKVMSEAKRSRSHIVPSIQPMHFLFVSHQLDNHSWDMAKTVFDLEETHPKLKKNCQNNNFRHNFFQDLVR